jgi:HAD superfamily hydrolase (TIGR01549 family)
MNKAVITPNSLHAILFDFDGVLCECMDVKTEAFAQMFESFGKDIVEKVVKHHVKYGGISRYKKIEYYYKEYLNEEITEEKLNQLAQVFSDLVFKKVVAADLVDGVKDFLEKYYQKLDLYVISGTPQEELDRIVDKKDMRKYFKGVFGSPIRKPAHARRIISENGYDINKVLYVGDSISDYNDSKEAGVQFLGRVPKGENSAFPNDVQYISDFFDILNNNNSE